jgi:hypothetical protein
MKKLTNLFEAVAKVDSTKYPNLVFTPLNGSNPGSDSINDVLLQDLNTAAGNAKIKANVTTAVSGHDTKTDSGNLSRHPGGFAVDIAMINGIGYGDNVKFKALGDSLVSQLKDLGYSSVSQETPSVTKTILWQVPNHLNHVHVSNTTGAPSSSILSSSGTTGGSDLESRISAQVAATNQNMVTGIGKAVNTITGIAVNENKTKRISEQINRIKGLM